ncbi:MAG TPA: GFA family protein [Alphaproteobacteria bacterium]|jgi:hypothetical protein|nr:GFA family protein [Alphaproteobacteria bacterium]HJM50620.1 GFA family protein [Alphaproteobacteria bacterium]
MSDEQKPTRNLSGGCLCGAVRFRIEGRVRDVVVCHCGQCRRSHGHVGAYAGVKQADLSFEDESGLTWYRSSDQASRGFCSVCGGRLFYRQHESPFIAVAAGSLDQPSGLATIGHIFTADAADYYAIPADQKQYPAGMTG